MLQVGTARWAAGAGPDLTAPQGLDSTIDEVAVGGAGAAFGYTKVRGCPPQVANCTQTGQVSVIR